MFKRKTSSSSKHLPGAQCPYCEFENDIGAEECKQCYYQFSQSARMQPVSAMSTPNSEILDILLSDSEEEEYELMAVEAVLSMDDVVVDVDQYSILESQDGDEPEEFSFFPASGPTLTETVESTPYVDEELSIDDAPTDVVHFEIEEVDPLEQVPEPVHSGRGHLFSPENNAPLDQDLTEIMQPPEQIELFEEPKQQNVAAPLVQVPQVHVPDLDDLDLDDLDFGDQVVTSSSVEETTISPVSAEESSSHYENAVDSSPSEQQEIISPEPQIQADVHPHRIWPWGAQEPWEDAVVVREVVSIMEAIQHGKIDTAARLLDQLGPHLTVNLDVLQHICVALQYVNRIEHSKWVAEMAYRIYPDHPSTIEVKKLILGDNQ
ncbi:MAG: hypothetical protein VW230_04325 [Candidatus Poseidoniales archaeon]